MKKITGIFCAALLGIAATAAIAAPAPKELQPRKHAQCYTASDLFVKDVEGAGKGMGTLHGEFAFRREQALPGDAIKEIGWMTLKKGAFIGLHPHKNNEDAYLIISGRGIFVDGNDNAWIVGPGDMTIARPGQKHALANISDSDLVFLDIIAENPAADFVCLEEKKMPQMYPAYGQFAKNVEGAGGGEGTLYGKFAFRRESADTDMAIKEIGMMTLKKGDRIGLHTHENNEDTYIIISGEGIFTDGNNNETIVGPKSVTIAVPGESHALRNEKEEDLVFIDLIAQNHALEK